MANALREYTEYVRPTRKRAVISMAPTSEESLRMGRSADNRNERIGNRDAIAAVKSYLEWVQRDAISSYGTLEKLVRTLQRHTIKKVKCLREERPLQLLAAMMGIAFATGLALRLWRISRNE